MYGASTFKLNLTPTENSKKQSDNATSQHLRLRNDCGQTKDG